MRFSNVDRHVLFFRGEIPDTAALTQAFKELDFPISVVTPDYPLEGHSGFTPMLLRGQLSGAEFLHDEGRDAIEEAVVDEVVNDIDPSFDRYGCFSFKGDWNELICGVCAAVAMAKLTNGVFYEPQDGLLMSIDQAIPFARQTIKDADEEIANEERAPATEQQTGDERHLL